MIAQKAHGYGQRDIKLDNTNVKLYSNSNRTEK